MRPRWRSSAILLLGLALVPAGGCIPDVVPDVVPDAGPSAPGPGCDGLASTCGPASNESCCSSPSLPPGSYTSFDPGVIDDTLHDITVSAFQLDRFEVTVGRFRRFVEAYPGSRPQPSAGAHPKLGPASGWSAGWDGFVPATKEELIVQVSTFCDDNFGGQGYPTWSDEPAGADEDLPMNCLGWFVAFAFCAWDGGRLPTEAEWNYAAAGGAPERTYPWGEEVPDPSRAVFECRGDGSADGACAPSDIARAGSRSPNGDGRWGQADLAGNMFEWTLDADAPYSADPCVDCAVMNDSVLRIVRGGAWFEVNPDDEVYLQTNARNRRATGDTLPDVGVRCARDL